MKTKHLRLGDLDAKWTPEGLQPGFGLLSDSVRH